MTTNDSASPSQATGLFGHPKGLMTLFFTEMWERFSYYGMRAILVLFMVASVESGGLGLDKAQAGSIYAVYTAMVYMLALPGGWIADNFLGQRKSVFLGGVIIMIGHVLLALHGIAFFYSGLILVVVGTGLLKPNISAIVGQLYEPGDARRDAGFSIFYMGINMGAFFAPLACGYLAQKEAFKSTLEGWGMNPQNSWHWGFGAAAVGMFFGLIQYVITGKNLGKAGLVPANATSPEKIAKAHVLLKKGMLGIGALIAILAGLAVGAPQVLTEENISNGFGVFLLIVVISFFYGLFSRDDWTPGERKRLKLIALLFVGSCIFWGMFEQAGSTLTLFADENTRNSIFGWEFPSSWWQSVNAVMIIALTPLFTVLWIVLAKYNPSSPAKFSVGMIFAGLGFFVLMGGAMSASDGERASPGWLFSVFLLHTIGELCLSPVGLSSMTKLATARVVGLMMGVWFLSTSVGSFIAGKAATFYESYDVPTLMKTIGITGVGFGIIMALFIKPVGRMLGGQEDLSDQG